MYVQERYVIHIQYMYMYKHFIICNAACVHEKGEGEREKRERERERERERAVHMYIDNLYLIIS